MLWVLLSVLAAWQATRLKVDFEFEKFFPKNDPEITFYEKHLQHFSYDNDYLLIVLEHSSIFEPAFLKFAKQLTDSLEQLPGTVAVLSPLKLQHLLRGPMGLTGFPLIHLDQPSRLQADSTRIYTHPMYSMFFGADGHSLLIQLRHQHFESPEAATAYSEQVQAVLNTSRLSHRLVGKLVAQNEFVSYIQNDFSLFLIAALIISFLLLLAIFRSLRVALLPYLISITTLLWLLGLMAALGYPLSILGALIPPIILFVSSSDAIHFLHGYRKAAGKSPIDKLKQTGNKVFLPTFLTSVTTAIGFFSLFSINTAPIQDLGLFSGIGVLLAFLVTFLLSPLLIPKNYEHQPRRQHTVTLLALWTLRHQKMILGGTLTITLVVCAGISCLKTDAYLLNDLPSDSQVRKDFLFVDQYLGGSKPWELAVWTTDSSRTLWEKEITDELAKIATYLHEIYPMEQLWSPVTFIKYGHQMNQGGLSQHFRLPLATNDHQKAVKNAQMLLSRGQGPSLLSVSENYGRFAGFIPEYGSFETIRRNDELLQFLQANVNSELLRYQLTGTTHLIDKSHELLSANLMKGLAIGIGIIGLILGCYFRSFKVMLLSLLPNLLPLLFTAGFMGLTGIPLKLTTSIIFAVAFGIAVDDTIHFVAVYLRSDIQNPVWRLVNTYRTAGSALILTTVVVVTGFSLFIASSFGATHFLGLFLSISLLVALLTDLTLLPLLLHYFCKNNQR